MVKNRTYKTYQGEHACSTVQHTREGWTIAKSRLGVFRRNPLHLPGQGYGSHLPWGAHYKANAHGPWQWISREVSQHHGGPHHLNGVLIFGLFWGNASDYPWWVIPMQGPSYLHKSWWGCPGLAAGLCLSWFIFLGHGDLSDHQCGSRGMWPWLSSPMGCWEGPSCMT